MGLWREMGEDMGSGGNCISSPTEAQSLFCLELVIVKLVLSIATRICCLRNCAGTWLWCCLHPINQTMRCDAYVRRNGPCGMESMLLKKFGRDGPARLEPMMGWVMHHEPERIVWRLRGRSKAARKWE